MLGNIYVAIHPEVPIAGGALFIKLIEIIKDTYQFSSDILVDSFHSLDMALINAYSHYANEHSQDDYMVFLLTDGSGDVQMSTRLLQNIPRQMQICFMLTGATNKNDTHWLHEFRSERIRFARAEIDENNSLKLNVE